MEIQTRAIVTFIAAQAQVDGPNKLLDQALSFKLFGDSEDSKQPQPDSPEDLEAIVTFGSQVAAERNGEGSFERFSRGLNSLG